VKGSYPQCADNPPARYHCEINPKAR
jgi:hypothetical protein